MFDWFGITIVVIEIEYAEWLRITLIKGSVAVNHFEMISISSTFYK